MSESIFGIALESLPGPKRGEHPALYFRDEVVRSPSGRYFALAYTIAEASMCNEVGCVLWGEVSNDMARIIGNPEGVHATCWYSPWAVWSNEETFVFKAQNYDGKILHMPLVSVNVSTGCAVIPGTNNQDSRPSEAGDLKLQYEDLSGKKLLQRIYTAHNNSFKRTDPDGPAA